MSPARALAAAALLAVSAGSACAAPPRPAPGAGPGDGNGPGGAPAYLYVCNQDAATVSVVDMETNEIVATVDLREHGFGENARPHHVAVEPDGSAWYLSLIGGGRVLKFDRQNRLLGTAEFEAPGMLAAHPGGDRLYVGRSMKAVNPPARIGEIRREGMAIEEIDVFVPRPHGLVVHPGGRHAYVGSLSANQIAHLDLETGRVEPVPVEGPHHTLVHFAISPDGRWMVGTAEMTGRLLVFRIGEDGSLEPAAALEVGPAPWHPVFTPDGRWVYVGIKGADAVAVVDTGSWQVAETITGEGLAEPHGAAVSPDGRFVYVSNNNLKGGYAPRHASAKGPPSGTVVVIETESRRIVRVLEVEANPTGLGAPPPR